MGDRFMLQNISVYQRSSAVNLPVLLSITFLPFRKDSQVDRANHGKQAIL